ncbi:NADH dehydrogenase 1 alpha subcomplex assembly factor 3 [Lasiosphaeria ovina]|uniref:NADH dehydrogenase 1 alpha subcomplex assembly factor 3 n=1 Tax=Lasiosphaeria ovina TaxID=92902 RepID=A0AAE0NF62_9PEZI|nr:NADH dehydrogenase 1 alpha subcomplex assembly factor 3 [Lasiosphaeria ovina]
MSDGFVLNSGITILSGAGTLLVAGDAFEWRPWRPGHRLLNAAGQWDLHPDALGVLALVWPRPDLLVLGLGPDIKPLSPNTRRLIASLGMRVEVLDTRNAASQFNMLATERGVRDVAAALIPIGWREGVGAV